MTMGWSLRWALLDGLSILVKIVGIYRIFGRTPYSPPSWLASSNLTSGLWTPRTAPKRSFHMCPHGFPTWYSSPPWGVHISEVALSNLFCTVCHRRVCNELSLVARCKLLSSPWVARRSLDRQWWDPSIMVLASTSLFPVVALYWVRLGFYGHCIK